MNTPIAPTILSILTPSSKALQSNPSTLPSLLTRFRVSYPTGSLIAEFLTVHDGNYAVRALVQVGGTTLASGMAADPNIEIAEDLAKVRALEALGMTSAFPPASFAPSVAPSIAPSAAPPRSPEPPPEPPVLKAPEKPPEPVEPPLAQPLQQRIAPTLEPPQPEAAAPDKAEPDKAEPDKAEPNKTVKPKKPKEEESPALVEEPQDRSDEIARIGVEMKRLGWTTIQGRDYLKQRYGKRSRQELNDPELLDFLAYLESQPAPVSS
jgi:hypothetical protein